MPKPTAVVVHGEQFNSIQSACKAYDVPYASVYARVSKHGETVEAAIEHCIKGRKAPWTAEEDRILVERYSVDGTKIPELKNRSTEAIKLRAKKLGISKSVREDWTEEEISILRREYPTKGRNIPELLNRRTEAAINTRARMLGLKALSGWSKEDVEILKKKYKTCGTSIPELLKTRGRGAICTKAISLGLETDKRRGVPVSWTQAEIEELYDAAKNNRKPNLPGRTEATIGAKMASLGIVRSISKHISRKPDVASAVSVRKGWIAVRCKKCGAAYILPEAEALKFEHSKCSSLTPVPKGWTLPWGFKKQ